MMSSPIFVTIAPNDEKRVIDSDWKPLKIDNKDIGFLQRPLLDGLRAIAKCDDGSCCWLLQFFANTEFKVDLFVTFSNSAQTMNRSDSAQKEIARAVWQKVGRETEPTEEQIQTASKWLRGAKSLKRSDYEKRSNRLIYIDGSGLSMFSTELEMATFERAVILLALACAYRIKIEELINTLSTCIKDSVNLADFARRACLFNALCYFRHPVQMRNIELPLIWDQLSKRFRLDEFDAELTEQTNLLYQLVTNQEHAKEQKRWHWVSFVLGLISAIQVLSLFSEETRVGLWRSILRLIGAGQ